MPTRLPGRRAVGRGGALTASERRRIEDWFVEGYTVLEVYGKCLDNGIDPPVEHALYAILNSESVQQQLRSRKAAEAGSRIAQIAERTRSRNRLLEKIEATVEARGDAYAELAPGGEKGLVVFTDRKSVPSQRDSEGNTEYETFDVYKTDTGLIEAWDRILNSQEKSDQALRRNLRDRKTQECEDAKREMEVKRLTLELEKLKLEVERLKREATPPEGTYEAPSFPAIVVERLPTPERAETGALESEPDEGTDPAPPFIPEEDPPEET